MTGPTRVAVVGGGVLGVSTAAQLARAGVDVVLVTEGGLASQASGRSLSWLNSAGIRSEPYHRFRTAAIDRYRTLAAEHPDLDWLRFSGGLAWLAADQADELHRQHRHDQALGYDSRLLSRTEVSRRVPGVDAAAVPTAGALWRPGEGWVDLSSLVAFLARDLVEHGGRVVTDAGPARVVIERDRVVGIRSERGEAHPADAALLATGAAVPGLVAELGVLLPDASTVDLLVATAPVRHALTAVLNTPRVSLRPRPDGGLSVDAGWASARVTRAADGGYTVDPTVVEELLAEASRVLAGHPVLSAAACGMGRKPIPGDGEPVLGAIDAVPGLYVAFTHSGATLGLLAGELLADEIGQGRPHPLLTGYNARRFDERPPEGRIIRTAQ